MTPSFEGSSRVAEPNLHLSRKGASRAAEPKRSATTADPHRRARREGAKGRHDPISRIPKGRDSEAKENARRPHGLSISVVTPTLQRPREVEELLECLAGQSRLPLEVILVDGAGDGERQTEEAVARRAPELPFACRYLRHARGTAIQRNAGIERARGDLIALLDDDVRPEPDYLEAMARVFEEDGGGSVGGVIGYRTNKHFLPESTARWRWYRRLGLLRRFEPGRYDFDCGYPVNASMQPPFSGLREVDFMTTACAMWHRQVFEQGLRFDPFFRDFGVLEDAHFSLLAGRRWRLLQCGDARCREFSAAGGREDRRRIGRKCVVNYYFVFRDVAGPLSLGQRYRFWRFQAVELLRLAAAGVRHRRAGDLADLRGRLEGIWSVATGAAYRGTRLDGAGRAAGEGPSA